MMVQCDMTQMIKDAVGGQVIKVLLAGRPTLFRHGVRVILRGSQPFWQLQEVDDFSALVDAATSNAPDLVLLDEHLPALDGLAGLRRLHVLLPQARLLVLGDAQDREQILDAINAGAQGYLMKSADQPQVLAAINTLLCGGIFAPAFLIRSAARLDMPNEDGAAPKANGLTGRQRDVFDLMAQGYSTKLIARELGLAVGTVKVHLAAIYRALGAHNRTEAVAKTAMAARSPAPVDKTAPVIRLERTYCL